MTEPVTDDLVLYSREDKVGIVTLNRPGKLNALSMDMRLMLEQRMREAESDDATSVVVLRAEGRSFCVGFDVGGGHATPSPWRHDALKYHQRLSTSFRCISSPWFIRKPPTPPR